MTPKQRDVMTSLKRQIHLLEIHYRHMKRQLRVLSEEFEEYPIIKAGDFTLAEVDGLVRLNQRLSSLEHYLREVGQQESARLDGRVADPNDPLDDYEIDATLYFAMRENDPGFDDDDDSFMTQRDLSLKCADTLADGIDHREPYMEFPARLNDIPHCWLFHDLYDGCYGLEQPALSLQDCLRVGWIWVDIAIRHQSSLDIDTGEWRQPETPA
ncbi:MAG: hypothetical protein ACOYMW_00375 [Candidatus Competibacteraceae bacterium]